MNKRIKTIFMGTPVFACSILEQLYQESALEVIAVISQPDRKVGRKQILQETPVKQLALQNDTKVLQPESIKESVDEILSLKPELIITCAYGQFVPTKILNYPVLGAFNVHASLLPKLRGGAPIHKAIMYGEKETGITIMKMVAKMDAGDIISQSAITINEEDTMGNLHDKLKVVGAKLLHDTLPSIIDGSYHSIPQADELVTYAWNISKEEEKVDFTKSYQEVYNHIRSLIPSPVSYGIIDGKKVKFWKVRFSSNKTTEVSGTILPFEDDSFVIAVDNKKLYVDELQLEGKQKMSAKEFKNGNGKSYIGKVFV